eukprot:COSAG06_NODE_51642_length_310_cov_10.677725_1_plen_80_part_00
MRNDGFTKTGSGQTWRYLKVQVGNWLKCKCLIVSVHSKRSGATGEDEAVERQQDEGEEEVPAMAFNTIYCFRIFVPAGH